MIWLAALMGIFAAYSSPAPGWMQFAIVAGVLGVTWTIEKLVDR